ncbi:MAG: hypothetical protein FJX35_27100 [Alphaproteobacteria bacterium]|nr:hypothetical protein [Alphaproteobacteria bacterium]
MADLYGSAALGAIGRIAAPYLDQAQVTQTELLHDYGHAVKLANAGTTLTGFVQQAAIEQVKVTGGPVAERVRELFGFTDAALSQAKALTDELAGAPPLTTERLNQLAPMGAARANAALTRHLADAPGWRDKIERILALFGPALAPPAEKLLDDLLAEILSRPAALTAVLDPAPTAETRITLLIMMVRREPLPPPLPAEAAPLRDRFAGLMAQRELPACRAVMTTQAVRQLIQAQTVAARQPLAEFQALRRLLALFERGGLDLHGEDIGALFAKRMGNVVTLESLDELIGPTKGLVEKLARVVQLIDQVVGPLPREVLINYLKYLFDHRDVARDITTHIEDHVAQAARVELLMRLLAASSVPDVRKHRYLEILKPALERLRGADRRTGLRAAAVASDYVIIEAVKVPLRNWSAIGLLFGPIQGTVNPGQHFRIGVRVRTHRGNVLFDAEANIVRCENGMVAAKYRCLGHAEEQIIQAHFAHLARKSKT